MNLPFCYNHFFFSKIFTLYGEYNLLNNLCEPSISQCKMFTGPCWYTFRRAVYLLEFFDNLYKIIIIF